MPHAQPSHPSPRHPQRLWLRRSRQRRVSLLGARPAVYCQDDRQAPLWIQASCCSRERAEGLLMQPGSSGPVAGSSCISYKTAQVYYVNVYYGAIMV